MSAVFSDEDEANEGIKKYASIIVESVYGEDETTNLTYLDVINSLKVICGENFDYSSSDDGRDESIALNIKLFHQNETEKLALKERQNNLNDYRGQRENDRNTHLKNNTVKRYRQKLNYNFHWVETKFKKFDKRLKFQFNKAIKNQKGKHDISSDKKKKLDDLHNSKQNEPNIVIKSNKQIQIPFKLREDSLRHAPPIKYKVFDKREPVPFSGNLMYDLKCEIKLAWKDLKAPLNRIIDSTKKKFLSVLSSKQTNRLGRGYGLYADLKKMIVNLFNINKDAIDKYLEQFEGKTSQLDNQEYIKMHFSKIEDEIQLFFENQAGIPNLNIEKDVKEIESIIKNSLENIFELIRTRGIKKKDNEDN
jgi:hypothetical protein